MDAIGRWRKVRYVGLVVWSLLFSSLVSARSNSGISSTGLLLPHCIRDFLPVPKSESLLGVPGYFSFPIPIFYQWRSIPAVLVMGQWRLPKMTKCSWQSTKLLLVYKTHCRYNQHMIIKATLLLAAGCDVSILAQGAMIPLQGDHGCQLVLCFLADCLGTRSVGPGRCWKESGYVPFLGYIHLSIQHAEPRHARPHSE